MHKESFSELPLSNEKQKFLRNEDCHKSPFLREVLGHKEDRNWWQDGPAQTNTVPFILPTYIPSHNFQPSEAYNLFLCLSLLTNSLFFVKMLYKPRF
jgi:hypothetical protein